MGFLKKTFLASIFGLSGYLLYLYFKDEESDDFIYSLYKKNKRIRIIRIPNHAVTGVIGRGGQNIIQIETQAKVTINFKENNLENNETICVIKGTQEACDQAENLILDIINKQFLMQCEDIWIDNTIIPNLTGKNNEHIDQISCLSGAKLYVDINRNKPKRRCTLTGTREQIIVAKSLIDESINEIELKYGLLTKRSPRTPPTTITSPSQLTTSISENSLKKNETSPKNERFSPLPGLTDTQFEVYVSAMIDPTRFWIQIVGPKATQLDLLVEEMTEYYKDEDNRQNHQLKLIQKGDLVAAIFKYDNKWYRAEVLKVIDENDNITKVELYYVDYGDIDIVQFSDCYEIPTNFLYLHFQAIECYLARIEPSNGGDNWPEEAIDKFEELTNVGQWKKLSAKINGYTVRDKTRAKREGSPIPGVDLFDLNDNQDIDIAQELVTCNLAKFKKTDELLLSSSRTT